MSTTGERVQVTPELLDAIDTAAANWLDGTRDADLYRTDLEAFNREVKASVVRALVARIRELEQAIEADRQQREEAAARQLEEALRRHDGY